MYKILSVGGSIIIPKTGFDIEFLTEFRDLILARVKQGDKFVLVIGGGATCRQYQSALKAVTDAWNTDLDWLGIYTTWYNAEFVRLLFGKYAHQEVVKNPTQKIKTNKSIIIAGGWKPGCSTDKDAVLLAKNLKVKTIANLSNVDFVYDKDPNKFDDAQKMENLSWNEFRKIVGDKWVPGANVPFDPEAAKLAQKNKLKVIFAKGTDLEAVANLLADIKFNGTVIE
ncbi:MAG: UMP kinase [Candidatus Magasanikbacteria bacterium]|jgi:uridylate kinase